MARRSNSENIHVLGERSTSVWNPGEPEKPEPSEAAPSPYHEGMIIGEKYRLRRQLGTGGMGTVWAAHNETLDIDVAIKVIRSESTSSDSSGRLLREARAAARLVDPAIVRVFDFGKTTRGDPFIVMELLEGEDLADLLDKRGRVSAHKAVRTILPIVHALSTAHAAGVIHRDLKPENIFLAIAQGGKTQPKLVDFGIAKFDAPINNRLTHTGALLGSPIYMSPEQARGDDVDHRADIWAICVVLYEAMTGRAPFNGRNYNAVLYSIIADRPAPITDMGVGDEQLWKVMEKGLAKNPDERWQSTDQLGAALAKWLVDQEMFEDITGVSLQAHWTAASTQEPDTDAGVSERVTTPSARGPRWLQHPWAAPVAAFGFLALAMLTWMAFSTDPEPPAQPAAVQPKPEAVVTAKPLERRASAAPQPAVVPEPVAATPEPAVEEAEPTPVPTAKPVVPRKTTASRAMKPAGPKPGSAAAPTPTSTGATQGQFKNPFE